MADQPIRQYPDERREQAEADTAGLTRDEETEAGETWEQQDDGLWTLPIEGGTILVTQRRSPEDRARVAAAWKQAERTVPRFTARPVTPEIEAAATARAVQAAADSEKTAAWFKETGGVLGAPAATEATDPVTITDPAWLRQQYADALRDHGLMHPDERVFSGSHDCCADAILTVRDRHLEQLRQRLQLADTELAQWAAAESADAAAGSYAGRAEAAEAALARIQALADEYPVGIDTALVHEALDQQRER